MEQRADLRRRIEDFLSDHPKRSAAEIAHQLRREGLFTTKSEINSLLYRSPRFTAGQLEGKPVWSLAGPNPRTRTRTPEGAKSLHGGPPRKPQALPMPPRAWQLEALLSWRAGGRRGIVEAVTGVGKTYLGVIAAHEHLSAGGKVVVLVPSTAIASQWRQALLEIVDGQQIGLLGNGSSDSLRDKDVLVATVQSGFKRRLLPSGSMGLLIADECHHYGAEKYSLALQESFAYRLGLTATAERLDTAVEDVLYPYFNGCAFRMGYSRALSEQLITRFRIALAGVELDFMERKEYDDLSRRMWRYIDELIYVYDFPNIRLDPGLWGLFLQKAERLARSGTVGSDLARKFLTTFNQRRTLLANTSAKRIVVARLAPAIRDARGTILFTQTKDAAIGAVQGLRNHGIRAEALYAGFDKDEREEVLARFSAGELGAVAAPRILDEGVNVPDADLAVVLAASRSRRQMIQRMGRVLRLKPDGRDARFAIVYVKGTSEDPQQGAHETFLEEVMGNADECRTLAPGPELVEFLAPRFGPRRDG